MSEDRIGWLEDVRRLGREASQLHPTLPTVTDEAQGQVSPKIILGNDYRFVMFCVKENNAIVQY